MPNSIKATNLLPLCLSLGEVVVRFMLSLGTVSDDIPAVTSIASVPRPLTRGLVVTYAQGRMPWETGLSLGGHTWVYRIDSEEATRCLPCVLPSDEIHIAP